jgi:hypothetical protein
MYQVKNNRRLARQLVAHVCARPAIIVDLCDAAAFIDMHGDRTRVCLISSQYPLRITSKQPSALLDVKRRLLAPITGHDLQPARTGVSSR